MNSIKHLGNTLTDHYDGLKKDLIIKRAQYIAKNNDLYQEFNFSHPKTRFRTNVIYNSHFTGSPLWDLFGKEAQMLENTWNTSFRIMYELPMNTHRYFVEAVSEETHARTLLYRRFIGFIDQIDKSMKSLPKQLLEVIKRDTRSTTGKNLRTLTLKAKMTKFEQLRKYDENLGTYFKVSNEDKWKVEMVKEITNVQFGSLHVENFSYDELEDIKNYLCTS